MWDGMESNHFLLPFGTSLPWLANSLREHLLELSPQIAAVSKWHLTKVLGTVMLLLCKRDSSFASGLLMKGGVCAVLLLCLTFHLLPQTTQHKSLHQLLV